MAAPSFQPIDVNAYIAEIAPTLKPPVANRVMFIGPQFFVMVVGGPNNRDDFHHQPGQELFWQWTGGMCLDVMEEVGRKKLIRKRIPINEGEMFLLPSLTYHSPQRFADTVGLVFERIRGPEDVDKLAWFVPNTGDVLYEESFHCSDIATQLKSVIERFMGSPHYETLKSIPASHPEISTEFTPFNVDAEIAAVKKSHAFGPAREESLNNIADSQMIVCGEYVVRMFMGVGVIPHSFYQGDTFLYQTSGESRIIIQNHGEYSSEYILPTGHATWFTRASDRGPRAMIQLESTESCLMFLTCEAGLQT